MQEKWKVLTAAVGKWGKTISKDTTECYVHIGTVVIERHWFIFVVDITNVSLLYGHCEYNYKTDVELDCTHCSFIQRMA